MRRIGSLLGGAVVLGAGFLALGLVVVGLAYDRILVHGRIPGGHWVDALFENLSALIEVALYACGGAVAGTAAVVWARRAGEAWRPRAAAVAAAALAAAAVPMLQLAWGDRVGVLLLSSSDSLLAAAVNAAVALAGIAAGARLVARRAPMPAPHAL